MPKNKKSPKTLCQFISTPRFGINYALTAGAVLLATTFLWALLSAKLQQNNSDQLINPYLFSTPAVFHGATFPAAHTFILKWPLFILIKDLGYSTGAYIALTIATVLVTVGGLAAAIYKLDKRPLVFGTLWLALASVLLMVPTQPAAGALLPVNMAMLTTRNLEYLLYIAGLALIIKSLGLRSWKFWAGVVLMALLIASDRLFLPLVMGGALIALVIYVLRNRWDMASFSVKALLGSVFASVGALLTLWLINFSHFTNIASGSGPGPYGLVSGFKNLILGIVYGIAGIFTNFGANPAYSATIVRHIPHQLFAGLFSLSGPAYLVNLVILLAGLYVIWRLVASSLNPQLGKEPTPDKSLLSLILIWSSVVALGIFALTNHYYAVDERYLTISLFAIFISAAVFARQRDWQPKKVAIVGAVLVLSAAFGVVSAARTYQNSNAALAATAERNQQVTQVLKHRPVSVLVGDYWRVVPIKQASGSKLNILPLSSCTQIQTTLSSKNWQLNLKDRSFAYLLTVNGSLTNFPDCTLKQVEANYGRPNVSVLIAGSLSRPSELVLFYDHGINKKAHKKTSATPTNSTVLPISLSQLPNTSCVGPTSLNIVAHQDDDLLFMNPDIMHDIKSGRCVRTVYVTAGDDGSGQFYWLSREQGSEAAYSLMAGTNAVWVERIVKIANNEYVTVANPAGDSKVSLIFMHLPDGNINGSGFKDSGYESLQKLGAGSISVINSVDGQSSYTSSQLTSALVDLMYAYSPTDIRTQANYVSKQYPDHSDHMAVGRIVKTAYAQYEKDQYDDQVTIPLSFYIGYPIHGFAQNVFDGDLQTKEAVFLAYAKFDDSVCQTAQQCSQSPTYGSYLKREYQNGY